MLLIKLWYLHTVEYSAVLKKNKGYLYTAMGGLCNPRKKPSDKTVYIMATFCVREKWGYKYIQINSYIKKNHKYNGYI